MYRTLKSFGRNLWKNKAVSMLIVCSLSIALSVTLLMGIWTVNEFSFDYFHKDYDQIYRLCANLRLNDEMICRGSTYYPAGAEAKSKFPEIHAFCRVGKYYNEVGMEAKQGQNYGRIMADSTFFTFFTYPLKMGDVATCLDAPDKVVISEVLARKYFPNENPLGKALVVGGETLVVSAVMYNMPSNSHLKAEAVTRFRNEYDNWTGSDIYLTYLKIRDPKVLPELEKKITKIVYENAPIFESVQFTYIFQSLKDIHFSETFGFEPIIKGNRSNVILFMLIALAILLVACINFINLFISVSFLRARSIGVKKTHGADKKSLMKEFYGETACYVLLAVVLALGFAKLVLPIFNGLSGANIQIDFSDPFLYILLGGLSCMVVLLTGTFPAFYMTRFNAIVTLNGRFRGKNLSLFQKGLVVFQFATLVVILVSILVLNKQMYFMVNKDMGFNKKNVLYVLGQGGMLQNYEVFRSELQRSPLISDVSAAGSLPTNWIQGILVKKNGGDGDILMELCRVKPNYFDLMGMEMLRGEGLKEENETGVHCVINETAAKILGLVEPLGEKVTVDGQELIVKGLVKDAQTKSLYQNVDPQIYISLGAISGGQPVFCKVQGDVQEAIQVVKKKWDELNPGIPFKYNFLNEAYAQLYWIEARTEQILTIAIGIVFLLSVAGLFAMAHYATQCRLKEVGIRRVNGATIGRLLILLNREFLVWIGIAFLIACPVAYWLLSYWLENFTEHIQIGGIEFILVGFVIFMLALITVSFQTWKAANVNPVKILRND